MNNKFFADVRFSDGSIKMHVTNILKKMNIINQLMNIINQLHIKKIHIINIFS